jgi:hypothetical protein
VLHGEEHGHATSTIPWRRGDLAGDAAGSRSGHRRDALVDVRGYGKSSRPPEMDQPAASNGPIVRTATAVKDVGTAVD